MEKIIYHKALTLLLAHSTLLPYMGESGTELRANQLQRELHEFAKQETSQREEGLARLRDIIAELTDPDTILYLNFLHRGGIRFQNELHKAINTTHQTGFEKPNGQIVEPWAKTKGYTLVVIDHTGTLHAGYSNPVGETYEIYGENLFPYALSKATLALHCMLAEMDGGIQRNWDYLLDLLPGRHIYQGDYVTPAPGFSVDSEYLYGTSGSVRLAIGANGCELEEHYHRELSPEGIDGIILLSSIAGAADTVFATRVGQLIQNYEIKTLIPEPEILTLARTLH